MRWNSFRVPAILAILAVAPALPSPTLAAGEWGIGGFAGFNTYTMSDLNDEVITPINAILGGTGYSMDNIKDGIGFGGGLRYRTPGDLVVGVDFERLSGSTDLTVPGGSFEITTPANTVSTTVIYYFPSASKARFGLGGGVGVYWSSGELKVFDSSLMQEERESMEGTGFGAHGVGAMDVTLSSTAHLEAKVGYRFAKTSDLTIAGEKQLTSSGDDATLDWSGLMTRVGFAFYFGAK